MNLNSSNPVIFSANVTAAVDFMLFNCYPRERCAGA